MSNFTGTIADYVSAKIIVSEIDSNTEGTYVNMKTQLFIAHRKASDGLEFNYGGVRWIAFGY